MTANRDPVDVHVGARIRLCRRLLGMSQGKLGKAIGVTDQQVQNCETGANRVSASRLWQLATMLCVPVSFFFDDMPPEVSGKAPGLAEPLRRLDDGPLAKHRTLELVRAYHGISEAAVRAKVRALVTAIGDAAGGGEQGGGHPAPGRPPSRARGTGSRGRRRRT